VKQILGEIERWQAAGRRVVLGRVVDLEGSGPRLPGAAMAVNDLGEVAGSVSGGCVEGAVVTEALELLDSGDRRLVSFGYSDDDAFAVGLTCGGTVHLFLEPLGARDGDGPGGALHAAIHDALREDLRTDRPTALATIVDGPGTGAELLVRDDGSSIGSLGNDELDRVVARDVRGELAAGRSGVRHYGLLGEARERVLTVFVDVFASPPNLVIFGAVDFTAALVRAAKLLGHRVTVCDAREVFATEQRFPEADDVVVDWPDRLLSRVGDALGARDAVCVLTHDHKFDVPAIIAALGTGVGFIGVMGSRRTHAERIERLRAEGITDDELARVHAPVGLDIGARTPEETAVSICAQIIALRSGHRGGPLSEGTGPIH
jgi:xanthine dehydrogenase accessory factor